MQKRIFSIQKDFSFQYTSKHFLQKSTSWKLSIKPDEDIHIQKGFTVVLGESGTGKSTLLSILGGYEQLTREQAKKISFNNKGKSTSFDTKEFKSIKKDCFGYIFQRCYESKSMNAFENIAMPLINRNYPKKTVQTYCRELLKGLNLSHIETFSANELSGGQLTRIGLLRGISQTPSVLFADEPTNNLDEQHADYMLDILKQWQKTTDGTVVMVTHQLKHAFEYADQIIVFQSNKEHSGEIVYYQHKKKDGWSDKEKRKIRNLLSISVKNTISFPELPEKEVNSRCSKFLFLLKMSWKNIVSKADGSRSISLMILSAFTILFFIVFSGNLLLNWLQIIDQIKNNDSFLRNFEIRVSMPAGLSKGVQHKINNVEIHMIRNWLISKIVKQMEDLEQKTKFLNFESPSSYIFSDTTGQLYDLINSSIQFKIRNKFKEYSYLITELIQKSQANEIFNRKYLRHIEQKIKTISRLLDFLTDISEISDDKKACSVFPRWESGPEFVKKNGQRRNLTTTIRWLDYRDPFWNDPRLKYLTGADFRFQSNNDKGLIIDIETFVDDLGYSINDTEVKIIYGNNEITCVPVRAVVERMPEKNRYHALTTIGFGEKIRSFAHHCIENRRYYKCRILFDKSLSEKKFQHPFIHNSNYNKGSIIYTHVLISDKLIEIDGEYEFAKTRIQWQKWADIHFKHLTVPFQIIFNDEWEVPEQRLKDPPYTSGTVYTQSSKIVRALGEYLSVAFSESQNSDDRCTINAYGYEEKIQFSQQIQLFINYSQWIGTSLFGFLFIIFMCTTILILIRNKASEIAIFQSMGGSLLSLLVIYNFQTFLLIMISSVIAFNLVLIITPMSQALFNSFVIQSLWSSIEEQYEAISAINTNDIFQIIILIFKNNILICLSSLIIMLITVSMMVAYAKYSPKYTISKILKER